MFEEFWQQYPKKVAKKDALKAWKKLSVDQQQKALAVLPTHCKQWDERQFIPYPASWLNGERFEDEIQVEQPKIAQWWTSDQGTLGHGNAKGMPPRPGESMNQYRDRLRAA